MEKDKRFRLRSCALEITDKLDIPDTVVPATPRMELVGNREFYMDCHRGVISYAAEGVDISAGALVVRLFGRELEIVAMTDDELRISGRIDRVELVE